MDDGCLKIYGMHDASHSEARDLLVNFLPAKILSVSKRIFKGIKG